MDIDVVLAGDSDTDFETQPYESDASEADAFFTKNAFRVIYQTNNFFLPQIKDLLDKKEVLNIRPEYQRRLRWSAAQKSKLIESLLLNIPVPPVFFYENSAARYEVMDGQQRLNAVREFLQGDFALVSLTVLKPLNTLRYSKCPPRIKRALDRASLSAIILLLESENENIPGRLSLTDIRRFIFDRLNTGGTKLNPQEIRNALNPGNFNHLITKLTRFKLFTQVFGIPPYIETDPNDYYENPARQKNSLYSTMGDCQLVLRYFALKDAANIRGSMKAILDRAMEWKISVEEAKTLELEYIERFTFLYELFEGNPFVLPADEQGRVRVSAAIYDASMVAINDLWDKKNKIQKNAFAIREKMKNTLNNEKDLVIMTGQGNTALAVKDRIELMRDVLCAE